MEGLAKFLKEVALKVQETNTAEQANKSNQEIRSTSSINSFASKERQIEMIQQQLNKTKNLGKKQKDHQRLMQQREDDEEDWELVGGPRKSKTVSAPAPEMSKVAMGAIGVAALGLGAFVLSKAFSSSEINNPAYVQTTQECREMLRKLEKDLEEYPVLGLDCQWTQTFDNIRSPIALLQLATFKGKIMLIPMKKISELPHELRNILRNYDIIKTGFEVVKDANYLREDYNLEVRSTFDLRFIAEDTGNRPEGLEKLSSAVLDLDLGRDWEIIKSDWDVPKMENHQIAYAEAAVKASIDIFKTLFGYINSTPTKKEIIDYCRPNLDKPFTWYTQRWD